MVQLLVWGKMARLYEVSNMPIRTFLCKSIYNLFIYLSYITAAYASMTNKLHYYYYYYYYYARLNFAVIA